MASRSLNILLVEDNQAHARLVTRSFAANRVHNRITHLTDGAAALDYVYGRAPYEDASQFPPPDLILLDLRLPKVDGLDVLREIKSDAVLKKIPVVILSTSSASSDMDQAYALHANSYLVKPLDFASFVQMMRDLGFYWLGWNRTHYS